MINVPNSKTGRDYPVPMNADVREVMMKTLRRGGKTQWPSMSLSTRRQAGHTPGVRRSVHHRLPPGGRITNLHWHDLRHTFGTRMAEAGFSEATIAELMGHTDPATTRRYTHATDRSKHEAVEAVRVRQTVSEAQRVNVLKVAK